MALMPERVNTRKVALAAEYGAAPEDLLADGFTEDYFETIRRPIRPAADADRVRVMFAPTEAGAVVRYRVYWFEEDRRRAAVAINEDWFETIGANGVQQMANLVQMIKCHQLS